MNIIKLGQTELEITSYNRNTYFNGTDISSTATCAVKTDNIAALNAMVGTTIDLIQIYHDNTLIYNLPDISATIDSISEYLSDDYINISLNIPF